MKWTTPILAELEVVLGEIIENLIGCEYGLKLVKAGYFQVFGALRENALFLDIAVAKAATLIALLPSALQKKIEQQNASTGCCEKEVE